MSQERSHATAADLDRACEELARGGVIVFPTETFYGLGCDPFRADAVERLLALKGRPQGQALPLVAGSRAQVQAVAPGWERWPLARRWADAFWPGPLSLVFDADPALARGVASEDGTVAVRVTSHPLAAALALRFGRPIVATSANRSGSPPRTRLADALGELAPAGGLLGLDGGDTPGGAPSTLVDPRRQPPRILREGVLAARDLGL